MRTDDKSVLCVLFEIIDSLEDWSDHLKLLIKGDKRTSGRIYDKIFNICDKYTTFFKTETDSEYETVDGYVIEFDCPSDAEFEISELKNVEVI